MTTPPFLPALPGITFSIKKTPQQSTRIAAHVSGREVRQPLWSTGKYAFELTISGLDSSGAYSGLGVQSLQSLMSLWISLQGQVGTFLYQDATDKSVTGQLIGQGDGVTTSFTLVRTLGTVSEVVSWCANLDNVYVNGVLVDPADYTFTAPNTLTFATPPTAPVTADFEYAFQCRFTSDEQEFEQFMAGLWQVSSLKFQTVKPPGAGA